MKTPALKKIVMAALEDLKAVNIVEKDVRKLTQMTDLMIFVSGTSTRHVKSMAGHVVEKVKEKGMIPLGVEGEDVGEWVLVDLGSILVHIMLPELRNLYDLETLWTVEPKHRAKTRDD